MGPFKKTRKPACLVRSPQPTRTAEGSKSMESRFTRLVEALEFRLDPDDTRLISGPSGIGKTVLLQSLAGLWPFASGRVSLPGTRREAMFVPQLPYIPAGDSPIFRPETCAP